MNEFFDDAGFGDEAITDEFLAEAEDALYEVFGDYDAYGPLDERDAYAGPQ